MILLLILRMQRYGYFPQHYVIDRYDSVPKITLRTVRVWFYFQREVKQPYDSVASITLHNRMMLSQSKHTDCC
jgi:hypothetical protein